MNKEQKSTPNHLINEKSPYLQQHAYNPVNWYPWGEEAFTVAEREDKLVFLSIGYATCHWCHVMERESFEDTETADVLNRGFIAIKVDREERPDIDSIYMDALHAFGQQGGWPLNIFLTPDKKPIFGGTYFPPVRKYGMNSFKEVLGIIGQMWSNDRKKLLDTSEEVTQWLKQNLKDTSSDSLPSTECFHQANAMYAALYDSEEYGFKTDARNKFPPSMALSYLMRFYRQTNDEQSLVMVESTLGAMKRGGIYDQVGGGLCRYSTDHSWLVPHFEKMLYDNALFLKALAECYRLTGRDFYKEAAYDLIRYIQRDLALETGGIASAEDADSEGEEGKFYLWSLEDFRSVTGSDSPFLEQLWNVTSQGNFEGSNILNENIHAPAETYKQRYSSEKADMIELNRSRLLQRRSTRIRPLKDDKILTSWNCLYVQALAASGVIFNDPDLINKATKIYSFIESHLYDSEGRLMRRYRDGETAFKGYLNDYAELGLALMGLYRATSELGYIEKAHKSVEEAIALFASDFGPFYETGKYSEQLLRRSINGFDGVEPSGNASMAKLLYMLSEYGIDSDRYTSIAEGIFRYFEEQLEGQPISCPALLDAYMSWSNPGVQIVIIAESGNIELAKSIEYLSAATSVEDTVVYARPGNLQSVQKAIPVARDKSVIGEYTAYVCKANTCKTPAAIFEELKQRLNDKGN